MINSRLHIATITLLCLMISATFVPTATARFTKSNDNKKNAPKGPSRVLVLDGSTVHNVGELQMHFINWGEWGSRPGTGQPYSNSPSAQWPAGSGIEYLFSAGIWVGALKDGVPAVSTAAFENEFRPTQDPRDHIYRTGEGVKTGRTLPSPRADDDEDGRIDEDRLDGYDNDGDGLIDEDFAAISRQMLTCRYRDNQPVAREIYPQHNPLNILVHQESYQWDGNRYDDFIAVRFEITNLGDDVLQDVYVAMFVDGDAGSRDRSRYWEDDLVGINRISGICTDLGPARFDVAYTFDADGDDGEAPGLFGVTFLDFPTDVKARAAPQEVRFATFAHFSGRQTFNFGGDPTNDFERYELMSSHRIDRDADLARDYRMLVAAGPFSLLLPDSTLVFHMAFVAGGNEQEIVGNAAVAKAAYDGLWFDFDGDPLTGIQGWETPVVGPNFQTWIDSCRKRVDPFTTGCDFVRADATIAGPFSKPIPFLDPGEILWVNDDCVQECIRKGICGYLEEDSLQFRTGVAGKERQAHWIFTAPPPPPRIRVDDHSRDGVTIYWDNFSETTPDGKTQELDFEGYRIWRADNWTRPLGTSTRTGPPEDLWGALLQIDLPNNFGEDTALDAWRYEPLQHLLTPEQREDFMTYMTEYLLEFEEDPPCPQGVTQEICDTLTGLAKYAVGAEGGRQYYRHVDDTVHLGAPYFYSVVAFDHVAERVGRRTLYSTGVAGDPASNFVFVEPKGAAQRPASYDENEVYVVPNPATNESMEGWALSPNNDDPTGVKIEFRNLPPSRGRIRIYTVAGDLVDDIAFDAITFGGSVKWDLVSRNGQSVTSGVYIYAIEFEGGSFGRVVKKFTVIR
jgi:hypothetical protein